MICVSCGKDKEFKDKRRTKTCSHDCSVKYNHSKYRREYFKERMKRIKEDKKDGKV